MFFGCLPLFQFGDQVMIPYGRQDIQNDDIEAVVSVLKSEFLTQGPMVPAFENAISVYTKCPHVIAVSSATAALHLACMALDLKKNDLVWTSPNTFVATANAALYCGANVDFVDIDPRSYCMSVEKLEEKLSYIRKTGGKLPNIVIPVHFAGQSCDMPAIFKLGNEYGFKIIEDASHAIGGDADNEKIGCGRYSDITVFSFHPVKIITTGEGGALATRNPALARSLADLRTHGITRDEQRMTLSSHGAWYYQMIDLGYNYRMTDIQAALGISQMMRIDRFIQRRRQLASQYNNLLSTLPVICPWQNTNSNSSYHLYPITLDTSKSQTGRKEVFDYMRSNGVGVNVHYIPVHLQPYYSSKGFKLGDFPNSENYYDNALTLPLFSAMTDNDQIKVVEILQQALML